MHHRPAFTRIQALLSVMIVALLTGIIVATLARLREAADSMKCQNNLKQLAVATSGYQATFQDRLPPLVDQGEGALTSKGLPSLFYTLIPHVEAWPILYQPNESPPEAYHAHSTVPFSFKWKDHIVQHGGTANQGWRAVIDPADKTADKLRDVPMTLPDGTTGYYSTGSYAANGLLPWGTASFPEGASNLILFGERPQVCNTPSGEVVYNLWGLGFYSPHMPAFATLTPTDPSGLLTTGQIAPVLPLPEEAWADRDARMQFRIGTQESTPLQMDVNPFGRYRSDGKCDARLPATPHREGMQVAMADGSVRVFSHSTSPWVFWLACVPPKLEIPPGKK